MSVLKDYGSRCRQYTVNVLFVIRIYGLHTMKFCQQKDTVQWKKKVNKTSHIERFNLAMRQRVSRLVRKTLSFSEKPENHIGAIWNFIHHYNLEIAPGLPGITTY